MQKFSLKDRLDQTAALLKAHAENIGIGFGSQYAVDGDTAYVACWVVGKVSEIGSVNRCVEEVRSLCTRLGRTEMGQCAPYGTDAVCCGTVRIVDHEPGNPHAVMVVVFPSMTVARARRGLDIANPVIPRSEVPELRAA